MILYRILRDERPTRWDFLSHAERGERPRSRLSRLARSDWEGVSTYDSREAAAEAARRYRLGAFIAILDVPDDGSVAIAQSLPPEKRHHFTLWAEPEMLIALVVATEPILPQTGGG